MNLKNNLKNYSTTNLTNKTLPELNIPKPTLHIQNLTYKTDPNLKKIVQIVVFRIFKYTPLYVRTLCASCDLRLGSKIF